MEFTRQEAKQWANQQVRDFYMCRISSTPLRTAMGISSLCLPNRRYRDCKSLEGRASGCQPRHDRAIFW